MITQLSIAKWFAKKSLAFWLRLIGTALILSILITPTCMYLGLKEDLADANKTIQGYKDAAEKVSKVEKKEIVKVEYKDRIVEKRVVSTKIKREYIYVNNEEVRDWGCTAIPDAVIGLPDNYSDTAGQRAAQARPLPDYCASQNGSESTADQ